MTISSESIITRGGLQRRLEQTVNSALAEGALHRIESRSQIITDGGIPFVVRIAVNLQRKAEEMIHNGTEHAQIDPFAPPESPLTVGAIGEGHLAVLNKYNVVENHLLLVPRTREHFEEISVNAMGFAGSLFVRNEEELLRVKEVGPLHMLGSVSGAG